MTDNKKQNISIIEDAPLFAGLEDSPWHKKAAIAPKTVKQKKIKPAIKDSGKPAAAKAKKSGKQVSAVGQTEKKPAAAKKQKPKKTEPVAASKPSAGKSELLLSVTDMCKLLGVSRATLVRMDSGNKIPGRMKLGGSVRYHRAVVESWLLELAGASE